MPPQVATVFFLFDLNEPGVYAGLLDVLQYQQRTGKWPPIPSEGKRVRATGAVNVRSGPGVNFPTLGLLKMEDGTAEWVEEKNGWTHIRFKKLDGWSSTKYLVSAG